MHAAERDEIPSRRGVERKCIEIDAVMDRREVIELGTPIGVGDRHERRLRSRVGRLTERLDDVVAALDKGTATLKKPARTTREFLASLTRTVPMFANLATDAAANALGPASPFAAVVGADEDEAVAALGEPGEFTNPAQVAFAWRAGIVDDFEVARALTFDVSAWGDYQWAVDMLSGKSLRPK